MPALLAEEVERRHTALKQLVDRIEAWQAKEAESLGLPEVLREGERLGIERDAIVNSLSQLALRRKQHSADLNQVQAAHGPFYAEAIERLRKCLANTRTEILAAQASQTIEVEDDQIVDGVRQIDRETNALQAALAEANRMMATRDRQASDLERVLRDFEHNNFDSARSYFRESLNLTDCVQRFVVGEIDGAGADRRTTRRSSFSSHAGEECRRQHRRRSGLT